MGKLPIYLQDETYACGPYCIMMVLKYFKINEEIDCIKQKCKMTPTGVNMYGLIECLKYYHIEANGYEAKLSELVKNMKYPCILHTIKNNMQHYIVLYKVKNGIFICGDPARGLVKMTQGELEQIYTQKAVIIEFVSKPIKTSKITFVQCLINVAKSFRLSIFQITLWSLLSSIGMLCFNYYFKMIIDYLNQKTKLTIIIFLVIGAFFVLIGKLIVDSVRNKIVLQFEKNLQEKFVFKILIRLLDLPSDYYERYLKNETIIKAQSLFELPIFIVNVFCSVFIDGVMILVYLLGLLCLNQKLFMVIGCFLIILVVGSYYVLNHLTKLQQKTLNEHQKLNEQMIEHIHHFQSINRFLLNVRQNGLLQNKFQTFINDYLETKQYTFYFQLLINGLMNSLNIIIFASSALLIQNNILTIGQLMLVYSMLGYLIDPILRIVELLIEGQKNAIIFERYKSLKVSSPIYKEFDETISAIAFENVKFAYGYKTPILTYVNEVFTHHKLVRGENGCGKSTFLKLLSGQLNEYEGHIYINHTPLKQINPKIINQKIGYLEANSFIPEMNVLEFILLDCYEEQPFLFKLIHKYHFEELSQLCKQSTQSLSKGQLQLVAFMKMMLLDFDVYIFDEAFNHMSQEVKNKVYQILESDFFKMKIVFVVDHQINCFNTNESYVIIEKGNVKIVRKHDELRN